MLWPWCRLQLSSNWSPKPGNFRIPQVQPYKEKEKRRKGKERKGKERKGKKRKEKKRKEKKRKEKKRKGNGSLDWVIEIMVGSPC